MIIFCFQQSIPILICLASTQHFKNNTKTSFWKGKKYMVNNFYSFCWNQCSARYFQDIIDFWQRSNLLQRHLTAIASDLPAHVLLGKMWFSHTAILLSMHRLLGKVFVWTQCSDTQNPYLQTAANGSGVIFFSILDWHNLCSMALSLQDLWTQQTPAAVGAFGHLCHLLLLAPSLAHTILFLKAWTIRLGFWTPWKEIEWFLWTMICRRPCCRCRQLFWHLL